MPPARRHQRHRFISSAFLRRAAAELASEYESQGFVVIPRLLSKHAVRRLQAAASRVLRQRCRRVPPAWILGLHQKNQPRHEAWVMSIAADPAVCRLLAAALGGTPVLLSSQLFVKMPASAVGSIDNMSGQEIPWHQDASGAGRTLTLWIALDDIDPAGSNGGLMVLPGLHRQGLFPTKICNAAFATFDEIDMAKVDFQPEKAVRYSFSAGGAGLHGPYTPHSSAANLSERPRRVLVLRYCTPASSLVKGEALFDLHGEVMQSGTDTRHQILCWSTGELIDRQAVLCSQDCDTGGRDILCEA